MRNLKRVLALAMAMVMILGMMVIGSSAASYSDAAAIDEDYAVAVEVLSGMGVFKGTGAGFAPKQILTRAEAATLIYRVITGDVKDAQTQNYDYASLKDIQAGQWYTGYVTYANNGGYIKGDDLGNFNPYQQVTGIQVMAIMLRAAGYGQNGEYEGAAWKDNILTDAREYGITGNISTSTLNAPATRELVAQLIFNAITKVEMVGYNLLFNYYPMGETLAEKVFNLDDADSEDVWGRPCTVYFNAKKGEKKGVYAEIKETPVAAYTTKVDECDIANDAGLKKTTDIESLWIDGVVTNSANDGKINPYSTVKNVGAQGRLTEVYDMGDDGVRIVEINTYLAKVTKVTKATTDKNGHTTDATVDFNVYGVGTVKGYETEDFTMGQYALVTVSLPGKTDEAVESAEATAPETAGYTTDWDKATTTIAKTEYNDADKFVLGGADYEPSAKSDEEICWDVFVDQYGNIIGAIPTGSNYLVIEKIEWKHSASSVGDGYALADIVLADGTKEEDVKIVEINGEDAVNSSDSYGVASEGYVSDDYTNNGEEEQGYYEHIYTYTVDEDGNYAINTHDTDKAYIEHDTNVKVVNGQATIGGNTNKVVATSTTVFLVENRDGYTYTVYVGKNEVPSGTAAEMCVLTDDEGYAKLVVLDGFVAAGNTFLAYVTTAEADGTSSSLGTRYEVYKLGETDATIIYDAPDAKDEKLGTGDFEFVNTGIYEIELNNRGQIVSMSSDYIADLAVDKDFIDAGWSEAGVDYNRVLVEGKENNTSFSTQEYANLTEVDEEDGNDYTVAKADLGKAWKDFNADEETVVIKVIKEGFTGDAKLVPGDMYDVNKGDVIIVGYTSRGDINNAEVIYVLVNEYQKEVVKATEAKVNFTLTVKSTHDEKEEVVYDLGSVTMTTGKATFILNHNSKQVDWKDATATIANDKRATGLTLTQYIDPALGTEQVVEVKAADLGKTIEVDFVLYID